jgi:murein DD-endopeptidase MepM/ murein hydrolase activator NlpD
MTCILLLAASGSSVVQAQNNAPATLTPTPPPQIKIHLVQPEETLESIATEYGIDVNALRAMNGLGSLDDISVGQRLMIPMDAQQTTEIMVQPGETLAVLAARYRTTPQSIAIMQGLTNPDLIFAGQQIAVASTNDSESSLAVLQSEDNLWRIALHMNINPYYLFQINNLVTAYFQFPGKVLAVPDDNGTPIPFRAPWNSITIHPLPLESGRTGGIVVNTSSVGTITGIFLDKPINFISSDGLLHEAVYGVDRRTQPGVYNLSLTFTDSEGIESPYSWPIRVTQGNYATETIKLSEDEAAAINDESIVQGEYSYIASTMSGFSPVRHWNGLFTIPTEGVLTSAFGETRIYQNSALTTFHTGADLATRVGTEIYAPADAIVVDTGLLDIRGYITILDHGAGVYTGYWHQSAILVKPGDFVTAGQVIGKVGNTGLSTASHLHWEMWVGGTPVDPMQWVREMFP